ncbi:MAG: hypothetical protein HY841_02775 [Bacteroidetes bacterium]|nr:hypothetical protein [Bacteroidota bacterium]
MAQIKFSDSELTELQSFYKQEYNKTIQKLQNIKGILSKLKSNGTNGTAETVKVQTNTSTGKKRGRKPHTQTTSSAPARKLGKWPNFIINTIKTSGKPMKALDIYPVSLKHFNAKSKLDQARTLRNLRGHLIRMTRRGEIKSGKKIGQRDNLFSIS